MYEHADRGLANLDVVTDIAGDILGWDKDRCEAEKASYRARCEAEKEAEGIWDEAEAQALRETVEGITPFLDVNPEIQG